MNSLHRSKRCEVAVVHAVAAIAVFALLVGGAGRSAWAQSPDWTVETIDDGYSARLAFAPDGNPAVAYPTGSTVKFVQHDGASWGAVETVSKGHSPHMAYDALNDQWTLTFVSKDVLKFARRVGASSWDIQDIERKAGSALLAYGPSGMATIVYQRDGLRFAEWNGTSWVTSLVESVPGAGSFAYDVNGVPHLASRVCNSDGTCELWLTHRDSATGEWLSETAWVYPNFWDDYQLAFDPTTNIPAIAVLAGYNLNEDDFWGQSRLVSRTASGWVEEIYDDTEWSGYGCSMAFDSNGTPYVSHIYVGDGDPDRLLVAHWEGGKWSDQAGTWMSEAAVVGRRIPGEVTDYMNGPTFTAIDPLDQTPAVGHYLSTYEQLVRTDTTQFAQRTSTNYDFAPEVVILSPADGATFASGATIGFEGTADDVEDGPLTASLVWTSSRDGEIGSGRSVSATLSDGIHTITASATDSAGNTGSDSVTITVGDPPQVGVSSITYALDGRYLDVTFLVENEDGSPVAGALVDADLYLNGEYLTSATPYPTDENGMVTYSLKNPRKGTYTSIVTGVQADGYVRDGLTPPNSFTK